MTIKQCKFVDNDGNTEGGIYCWEDNGDEYVICGCCGGVIPMEDIDRLYTYDYWINLSTEIIGDDER